MTRDSDVIIPQKDKAQIVDLVEKVAEEQNLPNGRHAWLNDGVSFFGLQTRGNKKI